MLRPILTERCKSSAPAAVAGTDRQWLCPRAVKVATYADRGLAILGYDRNSSFLTTVSETLEIAETTPGSAATKSDCQSHAARQITERLDAASMRYRMFLGASSCVPFPLFADETDKAASMQVEAVAARRPKGDVVTFTWPSRDAKPESMRSFGAGGVKADLADFGVENADEICVPFQFMYAMSTNFGDDDYRLAHAYRFCPCPHDDGHDSVAAAAHEQAEGLDRDLINSWEC